MVVALYACAQKTAQYWVSCGMSKYIATYAATALLMLALDLLWIGVLAKALYQNGIGHLMAAEPRLGVAAMFYALYVLGLVLFVVAPRGTSDSWPSTLVHGALFGLFAYATYDLTNLATLKDWPVGLSLLDMGWGALVSCAAAAAGKLAWDKFA